MEENRIPDAPITSHPELSPDLVHTNIMRCFPVTQREGCKPRKAICISRADPSFFGRLN
jgi:hypothetical protein